MKIKKEFISELIASDKIKLTYTFLYWTEPFSTEHLEAFVIFRARTYKIFLKPDGTPYTSEDNVELCGIYDKQGNRL